MITTSSQINSEEQLIQDLSLFTHAGGSIVQIRTREPVRAAVALRKHYTMQELSYYEWDVVNGFRTFTTSNYVDHIPPGDKSDFLAALERPLNELRNPTSNVKAKSDSLHFFCFVDPQAMMANNPYVSQLIQQYASILPTSNVQIILVTNDEALPGVNPGLVLTTELRTPSVEELEEVLWRIVESGVGGAQECFPDGHELDDESARQISLLGLGLTLNEFESHVALSILRASTDEVNPFPNEYLVKGISEGKTAVVKQSEILELVTAEDISSVGGMRKLKDWIAQRADCYSEEAKQFGVESPKGLVLVGVPGAGKSLVAKSVASTFNIPLVRLDFGRVFSKYVGDSESRVRSALKMVEDMSPVVLFVDEIDKGLGGAGGGGDSGTSSRVLGSFLTWLQELKAPVFTVVTANRVNGLPPELLRRGRFDQIFSVSLPEERERYEVLSIHLRKRGRDIDSFKQAEIQAFLDRSKGYVPAEIESTVKDALIAAYHSGGELKMEHLIDALQNLVPLSKSHAASIEAITQWARDNATPVNYASDAEPVFKAGPTVPAARRIMNRAIARSTK